jgi:hypothetical protein
MGLLDDAIREHLELKRRHGADPSEVERQEHEALGPARRVAAPPADADADADAEIDAGAVSVETLGDEEEPAGAPFDDESEAEPDDAPPRPSVPAGEPEAPVAPPAPEEPEQRYETDVVDDEVDEDAVAPAPPRSDAAPEDAPPAGEDVLEETPDFLQETPEHDRLWFEQKPPRDFEF